MKKIIFIIPYFGDFPPWLEYFLASCRANDDINFILFSDNVPPEELPDNIVYQHISFRDYLDLVSRRLGIPFQPENPYKLCDLKPALGLVHQDLLEGYDFWGFCDLDVIFGRLRHFLTESLLDAHDIITTHARRIAGHFTLVRNVPKYNKAFMQVPGWQQLLLDAEHKAFDEKDFSRLFRRFKNYPQPLARILNWMFLPLGRKALFREAYSTPGLRCDWVDGSRIFPSEWYWKAGRLTNDRSEDEFLYFHFLAWKREWAGEMLTAVPAEEKDHNWRVTSRGFEAMSSLICFWSPLLFI